MKIDMPNSTVASQLSEVFSLDRDYQYYRKAIQGERLPLAFVDMDLLDANAQTLTQRAQGMPMRIATKSLRCPHLMHYVLEHYPAFQGLMAFSPEEASFLADEGFDDILIGYPSVEISELEACLERVRSSKRIVFMVDDIRQVRLLDELASKHQTVAQLCLDIDVSTQFPFLHFGVLRSSLRNWKDVDALVQAIHQLKNVKICAMMGYEGQIAGVADHLPKAKLKSLIIRLLKRLSAQDFIARRQQIVEQYELKYAALEFVNGGGTGSIEETLGDKSVTELTVGSGLYSPALFDDYKSFKHLPAAAFALPVVRYARKDVVACSGGGYIASGPIDKDKEPKLYLMQDAHLFSTLGAGEVQTSVKLSKNLELGEPVFFRHAKAGELFERFSHIHLIRNARVTGKVSTYRGLGKCFF